MLNFGALWTSHFETVSVTVCFGISEVNSMSCKHWNMEYRYTDYIIIIGSQVTITVMNCLVSFYVDES